MVWSDIACPWCYVGKRRLEAALARFPHREHVAVVFRSFELNTSAPRRTDVGESYVARLAQKYGCSAADAEGMILRMIGVAAAEGLEFRFDRIRPGNTFDAHRLLHLGQARGRQGAVKERLLRAYLTEGEPIGDREALARLGCEAGLERDEVTRVLAGDAYGPEVREDEAEAQDLGIRSVPFFVFGNRYALSGAQPMEVILGAIEKAWDDVLTSVAELAEGSACGPSGCC